MKHYCKDCNKEINYQAFRCASCAQIVRFSKMRHPKYIDGKSMGEFFCKTCGCRINSYRARQCMSCTSKEKWSTPSFREKTIKAIRNKQQIKSPNKKEMFLESLLKNNYRFVGNRAIFFDGFNPDFIHNTEKKIIEFFGDYWHRNSQERDKKRIATYEQYGYKVLVIWEHELTDLVLLKQKLDSFN
jgi:very-short-patch-repair endonuclease